MASVGNLVVNLVANTSRFKKGMASSQSTVKRFAGSISNSGMFIAGAAGRLVAAGAGLAGVAAGFAAIGQGISLAGKQEQAQIAFTTLTGSAETAKRVLADLNNFAASTPFQLPGLTDAAKKLIAFGVAPGQVIGELRRIGDVSAGIGAPIGEIAEIYGKAKVQGRLFAEDINQLTGRGIPVIQELARQFGVTDSEVKKLVKDGRVNFGHLQQAFVDLTGEGGKFGGMMKAQSQSMIGLFSTLKDNISFMLRDIGVVLMDTLNIKDGVSAAISAVQMLRDALFNSFVTGKFIVSNFGDVMEMAFLTGALSGEILKSTLAHFFIQQIPSWLGWFGENWQSVWHTAVNFVTTALTNLASNVQKLFSAVWEFIKTGGKSGFNVDFTGLTEGFKNEISKLPDIPPRVVSDLEKQLTQQAGDLGAKFNSDLSQYIADERERFGLTDLGKPLTDEENGKDKNPFIKEQENKKQSQNADKMAGAISGFESGAFLQKLVAAQKKSGKTVEDKQLATQKKTENNTKKTNEHLQAMAEREPVQLATVPI